jgi:hypothetical protein
MRRSKFRLPTNQSASRFSQHFPSFFDPQQKSKIDTIDERVI